MWNLAPEYGFTDIDGRQPNLSERIVDAVTHAVLSLIDAGSVPPPREASNPAAIKRFKPALDEAITNVKLAQLLPSVGEGMYTEAIALGPKPQHEAVRSFARRHFSLG